ESICRAGYSVHALLNSGKAARHLEKLFAVRRNNAQAVKHKLTFDNDPCTDRADDHPSRETRLPQTLWDAEAQYALSLRAGLFKTAVIKKVCCLAVRGRRA